ncbi:hypothetical protein SCA6_012812 [Theobroma cacao]
MKIPFSFVNIIPGIQSGSRWNAILDATMYPLTGFTSKILIVTKDSDSYHSEILAVSSWRSSNSEERKWTGPH